MWAWREKAWGWGCAGGEGGDTEEERRLGNTLFRGVAAAGLSSAADPELEPRFVLATASSTL